MLKRFYVPSLSQCAALFCCAFASFAQAQNGQFDARLLVKTVDCDHAKITVSVQVRATSDARAFKMGDANYRFEYDTRQVRSPRIETQENFSNVGTAPDYNYKALNLQGSVERAQAGVVSLNTIYTGSANNAKHVGKDWLTVADVSFDVVDWDANIALKWHDDKTFPITGMSDVSITNPEPADFDYTYRTVAASNFVHAAVRPSVTCPNIAPTVATKLLKTPVNINASACYTVVDPDVKDTQRAELLGVNKGKMTFSLVDKQLCINYTPPKDYIGKDAAFFRVCDSRGACNTIQVDIVVYTDGVVVYNGFSPNGDGTNDVLIIEGLDKHPKNELHIYNRWGSEVYTVKGYKNDWGGKWNEGNLPDGTYFYTLDDGDGKEYKGYIQIQR